MANLTIRRDTVEGLLTALREEYDVFDCRGATLPFKQYLFPPEQEILKATRMGKTQAAKPPRAMVLFGLDRRDLEALAQLDVIMAKPIEDVPYWKRRKRAIVIGIVEDDGTTVPSGDVVFRETTNRAYRVETNSERAQRFVRAWKKFFQTAKGSTDEKTGPRAQAANTADWSAGMDELLAQPELLANAVEWSHDHRIWDELAKRCLGCGICTYVCPLCYCFATEDRVGLDDICRRCRRWDACTLLNFSRVAGGFHFKPTLRERYYNWFYHKFVRAYREYGKPQCVGCGRCKQNCPASIDIQDVLRTIVRDYEARAV